MLAAVFAAVAFVADCAQDEPVRIMAPQPVFDKYGGGGSCEGGVVYFPGAVPKEAKCVLPPEKCVDAYDVDGSLVECQPPGREPGDDDREDTPGAPTSSTPGTSLGTPTGFVSGTPGRP